MLLRGGHGGGHVLPAGEHALHTALEGGVVPVGRGVGTVLACALVEGPVAEDHLVPLATAAAHRAVHHLAHVVLVDGGGVDTDLVDEPLPRRLTGDRADVQVGLHRV